MSTKLMIASMAHIHPNPHRDLGTYPFIESKINALMRSINDVGFWEGVIARQVAPDEYEIAFGHHRIEAARRSGIGQVTLIVRDLTDEQMLKFMGRENGEDYNANFLIMLETWDAAVQHIETAVSEDNLELQNAKLNRSKDVARFLGWTTTAGDGNERMNPTAAACSAAHTLIQDGHVTRDQVADMSVFAARQFCTTVQQRMKTIDKQSKIKNATPEETAEAKRNVTRSAAEVADKVKSGDISPNDIRSQVDIQTGIYSANNPTGEKREPKRRNPLLDAQIDAYVKQVSKLLTADDSVGSKLASIKAILKSDDVVIDGAAKSSLDALSEAFASLERRAGNAKRAVIVGRKTDNVVDIKEATSNG